MSTGAQSVYSGDIKNPDLFDVMRVARRSTMLDLRVMFPATVSAIQDNGAKVKVVPDIKDVLFTEDGEQVQESLEISDIPVWTYGQGAIGGGYLQFPVRVGDKGWVHISDRALDGWYENGLPAPPAGTHTHSLTDGLFVPGARDRTRALSQDPTAVVLEDDAIKIGKLALLDAARTTDAVTATPSMAAWLTAVSLALGFLGATTPPITGFGTITGGSGKTKIE